MIEKVTISMNENMGFSLTGDKTCTDLNPKAKLLYAAAECSGLTLLHLMKKERVEPKSVEITVSGALSTETLMPESIFTSFNVIYNIECHTIDDQIKISRAVNMTHDKYCGLMKILRMIAPVSHETAIVSTEPAKPKASAKA